MIGQQRNRVAGIERGAKLGIGQYFLYARIVPGALRARPGIGQQLREIRLEIAVFAETGDTRQRLQVGIGQQGSKRRQLPYQFDLAAVEDAPIARIGQQALELGAGHQPLQALADVRG